MLCKKWENLLLTRCCLFEKSESKVFDVFCIFGIYIETIKKMSRSQNDMAWFEEFNIKGMIFFLLRRQNRVSYKLLAPPVFYFVDVDQHSQCSCRLFVSSWFSRNFHQIRHCWEYFFTWIFPFLSFSGGAHSILKSPSYSTQR